MLFSTTNVLKNITKCIREKHPHWARLVARAARGSSIKSDFDATSSLSAMLLSIGDFSFSLCIYIYIYMYVVGILSICSSRLLDRVFTEAQVHRYYIIKSTMRMRVRPPTTCSLQRGEPGSRAAHFPSRLLTSLLHRQLVVCSGTKLYQFNQINTPGASTFARLFVNPCQVES